MEDLASHKFSLITCFIYVKDYELQFDIQNRKSCRCVKLLVDFAENFNSSKY